MSARQAYPALPPHMDAKCEGCATPYRRVGFFPGNARVVVKQRLKLVMIAGHRARLCDKCRKLNRKFGGRL